MRIFLLAIPVVLGCGDGNKADPGCAEFMDGMVRAFAVCEGEEDWESEEELQPWIAIECEGDDSSVEDAECTVAAASFYNCALNGGWAAYADECPGDESPVGCEGEEESFYSCLREGEPPEDSNPCDLLAAYFCEQDAGGNECERWIEYAAAAMGNFAAQSDCQDTLDSFEAAE